MKKLLFALVLGILLVAAIATTVMADNGPHGGVAFSNGTTDACAGCHRAHSAKSSDGFLLVATDIYSLCTSCHDGTGAYTDVVDGYYTKTAWNAASHGTAPAVTQGTQDLGLFAGGFINARMVTAWNGHNYYTAAALPTGVAATDAHSVGQGTFSATGTMWGSGDVNAAPAAVSSDRPQSRSSAPTAMILMVTLDARVASAQALRPLPIACSASIPPARTVLKPVVLRLLISRRRAFLKPVQPDVYVADVATKWYTPNTLDTADPTVKAYSTRWDATAGAYTDWTLIIAQPGDYLGRSYMYQSPAVTAYAAVGTGGLIGSVFTCTSDGTATGTLPALPATEYNNTTNAPVAGTNYYTCGATTGAAFNNNTARANLGLWCGMCHDRYLANGGTSAVAPLGSRTNASGDQTFMYRHATTGSVVCVDCHVAHGTSASEYTSASNTNYGSTATFNTAHPSDLLKLDNRAFCVRCHARSVNFQFVP